LEDKNKPGKPRDISDLKARLGLAKPGAAPRADGNVPQTTPSGGVPFGGGGSLGAGGQAASRPLPAPFQQPAAAPPDARKDPFGAMSGAVAAGAAAAQPAYRPYVDDGKPVENVMAKRAHRASRITIAVFSLLALVVGYWWGGIIFDRKMHNRTIEDAVQIKEEVEGMKKTRVQIQDLLLKNQQAFPTGAPDFGLVEGLDKLGELKAPNQQKLFQTNYMRFENIAIDELFNYYNDTISMYEQVRRHVAMSNRDKEMLTAAAANARQQDVAYGVVIEPGKITSGKLVQMVGKVCKGGKPDCGLNELEGMMVTGTPGAAPFKAVFQGSGAHVIPLDMSPLLQGMMEGAKPEQMAANDYKRRLNGIRLLALIKLPQVEKSLLEHLSEEAAKSKLTTF
jgi:hypothetical protein